MLLGKAERDFLDRILAELPVEFDGECTFFPDSFRGADLSGVCLTHDWAYRYIEIFSRDQREAVQWRKYADRILRFQVYVELRRAGSWELTARLTADTVYWGVRAFGGFTIQKEQSP